ncbi:hypothetical protein [Vibrio maerlii]|uniref:hypothetical protein n=1 Tax=Vibrio maerlii TaxID=2231648 RepID=UPI000E3CA84D|nr:hypothetical protein [Vibrio maerlii]
MIITKNIRLGLTCSVICALTTALISTESFASDLVTLGEKAFSQTEGIVAVNVAAGNNNNQSSNFVHSQGKARQLVVVVNQGVSQQLDSAKVEVQSQAFNDSSGYISIQLAAGDANNQHNVVMFSPDSLAGYVSFDLSDQRASASGQSPAISQENLSVELSPNALSGASGVVQMSQIAGSGNTARNTFQMPTTLN